MSTVTEEPTERSISVLVSKEGDVAVISEIGDRRNVHVLDPKQADQLAEWLEQAAEAARQNVRAN